MPFVHRDWPELLVRQRYWLLAVVAVLYFLGWPIQPPHFDRSLEQMFAADDPVLAPYRHFQRTFGGNAVILAVYDDPEILALDGSGLRRLAELSGRCRSVPGVRDVFSLDRILGDGVDLRDATARKLIELFSGITQGADQATVAVVCLLDAEQPAAHARAVEGVRHLLQSPAPGLSAGFVTGEPVLVHEGFQLVESDGRKLSFWTLVLLSLTILIGFRQVRWMVVTLLVVHISTRLTESLVAISGMRLTLVSSMLSAIIAVVAIGTMVHLIVWFQAHYRLLGDPQEGMTHAVRRVIAPIIWSCITDAVGFGALVFAHVSPVRDFGIMTAIGSLIVLLCVVSLFPALALFGTPHKPLDATAGLTENRILQASVESVFNHPKRWLCLVITLTVAIGWGSLWVEVETDFTRNFRRNSSIVRAYSNVEERLGGAGVLEIAIPAPAKLTWEYLERVRRLEQRLRAELGTETVSGTGSNRSQMVGSLTKVLSLADALVAGSPVDLATLPTADLRDLAVQAGVQAMRFKMPVFVDTLFASDPDRPDEKWFRIMLRAKEQQGVRQKLNCIDAIQRILREETTGADWPREDERRNGYVSGYFVLLSNLIQSVSRDQWLTFAAATAGVAVCLLLAFRRPMLALIALTPNIIPGFLVLGFMGWLGLKINMGAAMIAAVSMGLTVDSSVHYLTAYLRERSQGATVFDALQRVQQGVGRAAVLSTIALMVGFSVLCTSEFVPTVYFGLLVNLAMLGGVAGNLILLPLLLRLWDRRP